MARKVDIINDALSRLGISGITREPTSEDMAVALPQLELMMHSFLNRNVRINYNFEETPDPQSETNVSEQFHDWMAAQLAVRLIPYFGEGVDSKRTRQLRADARSLYSGLATYRAARRTNEVRYPARQPRGHGNTLRHDQYDRYYPDTLEEIIRDVLNGMSDDSGGNGGGGGGGECNCEISDIPGLQAELDGKADVGDIPPAASPELFLTVTDPVVDTSASIISGYIQDINRDISGEVTSPQSIAYNELDNSLYVLQQGTNMIFQYNLDGTRGQRTIDASSAEFSNNRPLTSLAIHNGFFYALAGRNTNPATSFLRRWPVSDSSPPTSWTTPANQILSPIPFADSLFLVDNLVHQISGSEGYVYAFATIIDALTPFTPPTIPAGGLDRFTEGPNDTIYGVNLANGDVRIQAFTEDYEPAGPLFTVVGSPPPVVAGDQIVAAGTDIYSTNLNTEVLLRYNSQETTGITLAGTNIAFLAEINGGLNLPGGGTATVTTAIDDNTIAISTSATLTDGVLTGDVTRIHSVGDVTEVVKVDPLLIAPRPND